MKAKTPRRYTFDPARLATVRDGRTDVTFDRLHKGGHARLGEEIELAEFRDAGPFYKGRVAYRARAAFDQDGLIRVFGPDGLGADPGFAAAGDGVRALFYAAERGGSNPAPALNTLATRAGFADYAAAWAHIQTLGRKAHGRVIVEVIGWAPAHG